MQANVTIIKYVDLVPGATQKCWKLSIKWLTSETIAMDYFFPEARITVRYVCRVPLMFSDYEWKLNPLCSFTNHLCRLFFTSTSSLKGKSTATCSLTCRTVNAILFVQTFVVYYLVMEMTVYCKMGSLILNIHFVLNLKLFCLGMGYEPHYKEMHGWSMHVLGSSFKEERKVLW